MHNKKRITAVLTGTLLLSFNLSAFAEGWQQDDIGWRYAINDDNTEYFRNGWKWIDGNGDRIAECYYFGEDGYLWVNTLAPNGHQLNQDGAWVHNGTVVIQVVASPETQKPIPTGLPKGQWVAEGTQKKYVYSDGTCATNRWLGIEGFIYHFDDNGFLETSKTVRSTTSQDYCLDDEGRLYKVEPSGYTHICSYRYDSPASAYDPQNPLKGHLSEYGLEYLPTVYDNQHEFRVIENDDPDLYNAKYKYSNAGAVQEYAYALSGYEADYSKMNSLMMNGYSYRTSFIGSNPDYYPEVCQVIDELRAFLNSFDFAHASEMERAQKIADYVSRASYDYETEKAWRAGEDSNHHSEHWETATLYGCLINKKCVCQGYSDAFHTLARLTGLLCVTTHNDNHQWDYVRIDGQWWLHSNGELFKPGTAVTGFGDEDLPPFESSSFAQGYAETYPDHPNNWAYLP